MRNRLREQCRCGAQNVLVQRGWELVQDEPAFVEFPLNGMTHEAGLPTPSSASIFTSKMRAQLEKAIRQCLRSRQQQTVLIQLFLDEKSAKEVADALGRRPADVYVLKCRAIKRLRECGEFLAVLEDLVS